MRRRLWFDWHSWVGLNLSVLLAFVLFTGTLATVSRELDWLSEPAMRVAPSDEPIPWGTMVANFRRSFPEATARYLSVVPESWIAPQLIATDAAGERFRVFFDPASGAVRGTARWFNWQRFLREAHRHLLLPLEVGLTVVGLLSIPLLISFVSSLYVHKRWWRALFRFPRAGQRRRRFWGDLHRLVGVWSLWFVLLMAVTGGWYLLEHLGLRASLPTVPEAAARPGSATPGAAAPPLDELLREAAVAYPELRVRGIFFDPDGTVRLQGQADALLVRDRANQVTFDGRTGALLDVRRGEALDWHNRISEAADPLHFGTFANTWPRYLWALFGLAMTTLSLTGVYLFGLRTLAGLHDFAGGAAPVWHSAWQRIPGRYRAPQALLVALCLLLGCGRYLLAS